MNYGNNNDYLYAVISMTRSLSRIQTDCLKCDGIESF